MHLFIRLSVVVTCCAFSQDIVEYVRDHVLLWKLPVFVRLRFRLSDIFLLRHSSEDILRD